MLSAAKNLLCFPRRRRPRCIFDWSRGIGGRLHFFHLPAPSRLFAGFRRTGGRPHYFCLPAAPSCIFAWFRRTCGRLHRLPAIATHSIIRGLLVHDWYGAEGKHHHKTNTHPTNTNNKTQHTVRRFPPLAVLAGESLGLSFSRTSTYVCALYIHKIYSGAYFRRVWGRNLYGIFFIPLSSNNMYRVREELCKVLFSFHEGREPEKESESVVKTVHNFKRSIIVTSVGNAWARIMKDCRRAPHRPSFLYTTSPVTRCIWFSCCTIALWFANFLFKKY